jgi:hypothetical protein
MMIEKEIAIVEIEPTVQERPSGGGRREGSFIFSYNLGKFQADV